MKMSIKEENQFEKGGEGEREMGEAGKTGREKLGEEKEGEGQERKKERGGRERGGR